MIWFNRIASLSKGKVGKNVGKRRNAEGFIVKDGSWTLCFVCQSFVDVTDKLKVYISLGVREKLKLYRSELEFWCVCVRACVHVCVCARTCVHACVWVRRARVCVRGGVILGTGKKGQQIVCQIMTTAFNFFKSNSYRDSSIWVMHSECCSFHIFLVPARMNSSEKEFYREKLLTLSGTSSDEYVKGIYDQWADNYDKV